MRKMSREKVTALCFLLFSVVLVTALSLPVHAIALNFGYASIGDSNAATFGGVYVSNFTSPPIMGNITQINTYLATGGTTAKAVIYGDYNGQPYTLLGESSPIRLGGTSGEWVNFSISYTAAPNTVYWLGIMLQNAGTYYYSSRAEEQTIYSAPLSDNLNPFPTGNYTKDSELSIVAIYTPATIPDSDQGNWLQTGLFWIAIAGIIIASVIAVLVVIRAKSLTLIKRIN